MKTTGLTLLTLVLGAALSAPAAAQPGAGVALAPEAQAPTAEPPPLSLVAEVGSTTGLAAGAQIMMHTLGVRATGGFSPVLVSVSDADTYELDSLHVYGTGQLNLEMLVLPIIPQPDVRLGVALGYRYNSLLEHGGAITFEAHAYKWENFGLRAGLSLSWFPDGDQIVRDELDTSEDVEFNFPWGAGFQSGLTIAGTFAL